MVEVPVSPPDRSIKVEGLTKVYDTGEQQLTILRDLDLSVASGESVAVVGRSGAGKSTLLHLLGLLDRGEQGRIHLCGEDVTAAGRRTRDRLRREQIGFVFQFYHLLPELSALENVLLSGMMSANLVGWMRKRRRERERAYQLLERVGLADRAGHRPAKLSGGEQQRVAIARALFRNPAVLLCDEPTGNLDEHTSGDVEDLLIQLQEEQGMTMVLVTHNLNLARRLDRLMMLEAGRLRGVEEEAEGTGKLVDASL